MTMQPVWMVLFCTMGILVVRSCKKSNETVPSVSFSSQTEEEETWVTVATNGTL